MAYSCTLKEGLEDCYSI